MLFKTSVLLIGAAIVGLAHQHASAELLLVGEFRETVQAGNPTMGVDEGSPADLITSVILKASTGSAGFGRNRINIKNVRFSLPGGESDDLLCLRFSTSDSYYFGDAILTNLPEDPQFDTARLNPTKDSYLSSYKPEDLAVVAFRKRSCEPSSSVYKIAPFVLSRNYDVLEIGVNAKWRPKIRLKDSLENFNCNRRETDRYSYLCTTNVEKLKGSYIFQLLLESPVSGYVRTYEFYIEI